MKKLYQITDQGKKELEAELVVLKGQRAGIADKISDARDFGDLSENAEYDAAREAQGLLESRVAEIEDILLNADIIKGGSRTKVALGSTVELKIGTKTFKYRIVGPVEADPLAGKISNESPMGEALFGKKVGENAIMKTPKGDSITYEIASIN